MAGDTLQASIITKPILCPQGEFLGKPDIVLSHAVTSVGSKDSNRLHLRSRTVSKVHAIFVNSGTVTFVADLASRTGVMVNGRSITWSQLQSGDLVQIGKFEFRFRAPPGMPLGPEEPPPAELDIPDEMPVPVSSSAFIIGSRENASICISHDPEVSTAHAILFPLDGRWHLRDLFSRTGTKLNGRGIHQRALEFGDTIEIGSMKFRFVASVTVRVAQAPAPFEAQPIAEADEADEPVDLAVPVPDEPLPLELDDLDFNVEANDQVDLFPLDSAPAAETIEQPEAFADEPLAPLEELPAQSIEQPPTLEEEPLAPLEEIALEEIPAETIEPAPAPDEEPQVSLEEIPLEEVALEETPAESIESIATPIEPAAPMAELAPIVSDELETSDDEEEIVPLAEEPAVAEMEIAPAQAVPPSPAAIPPEPVAPAAAAKLGDIAPDEEFVAIPELDFGEVETTGPAQSQPPVGVEPVASEPPIAPAPALGPSMFGFKFDGGSFMGGRPLVLRPLKTPAVPPPAPVVAPAPIVPPAAIAAPTAAAPQPVESAPARAAAPKRPAVPPPIAPSIPAVPAAEAPSGPFSGKSLTDLFVNKAASAPRAEPAPAQGPAKVATLSDAFAVPPLAQSAPPLQKMRRPLTTAFDGLSKPPANADVFSQVNEPISPDLFGGAAGEVLPDVAIPGPRHQPARRPVAHSEGMGVPPKNPHANVPPLGRSQRPASRPRKRRLAVPALVGVMIFLLGGVWAVAYLLIPQRSRVAGTLAFSNLGAQSPPVQQAFQAQQTVRLHSADVRTMARSLLIAQHIEPGWLDDPVQFDQTLDRDGSAVFKDEALNLNLNVPDQSTGRAQVSALLTALSEKNADLSDTLARAHRQASDAHVAVDQASARLDQIKTQIVAERVRGEDRPDPAEIANLEAQSVRLSTLLASARAARVDAEDSMSVLHSTNTTEAPSPQTDPKILQLRQRLSDLSQQMADRRSEDDAPIADTGEEASTRPVRPDADSQLQSLQAQADAVTTQINQRLAILEEQKNLSPEQREVQRQKAIEDLSIKITDLRKSESDAAAASQSAADNLRSAQIRLQNARSATDVIDQLIRASDDAQNDLKARSDEAADADRLVAACISVSGQPQVSVLPLPDQRPLYAGISSGVILLIFCGLIVSAAKTAHAPAAVTPQPQPHTSDDGDHPMPVL